MINKNIIIICSFFCIISFPCLCYATSKKTFPKNKIISKIKKDNKDFLKGYELFKEKEYRTAIWFFYKYLNNHEKGDEEYNLSEFYFGVSLKEIGLTHGAVDVLANLLNRNPDPKIVVYCLEIFEQISRTISYDKELIIKDILASQEYGFLEGDIADFVHFYQGEFDWDNGFSNWANDHFNSIKPNSYYYYKYMYKKALSLLLKDKIDASMSILEDILRGSNDWEDIQNDVRQTLARLLYEKGKYKESIVMYKEIEKPTIDQAHNLLERAWSEYRMGKIERSMGLLYAYSAPSFKQFFTPEYYMLKSFIYKNVCHYKKALSIVLEFKDYYSDSLRKIYKRGKPENDDALLLVILAKSNIKKKWNFLNLLESERKKVRFSNRALMDFLIKIYNLQIKQTLYYLKKEVRKEYELIANMLLKYEEDFFLMEYEIGLDMYQKIQLGYTEEVETEDEKKKKTVVVYPFQGEYWNDELGGYRVILPNKCNDIKEWDLSSE